MSKRQSSQKNKLPFTVYWCVSLFSHAAAELGVERTDFITKRKKRHNSSDTQSIATLTQLQINADK